ncbi:MAG: hypothetical protein CL844_05190 [Crocinitomicaceae bacterium]|nr:hypothetical protein [Crocinitomicaceae bacterium]|tara:strand:- start:8941 stop:9399 length:459 start_codon:yes stop_codon:yes gene_type:complete
MNRVVFSLILVFFLSSFCFSSSLDIDPVSNWTEYKTIEGVKIEYIFKECNSELVYNQTLVLFRFTNTTDKSLNVNWKLKIYRDGTCYNCNTLYRQESLKELHLNAGEVFVGDCSSKIDKRGYIFSHFNVKSPGMSDSILTDFEFLEFNVINL